MGAAWMVRNHEGVVVCHSRKAFAEIKTKDEAKLQSILRASESMTSLRLNRIITAGEFEEFFGAVMRPFALPSFLFQRDEICMSMKEIGDWQVLVVKKEANRGASFIADSVNKRGLVQSYVARGHPTWLSDLFLYESRCL